MASVVVDAAAVGQVVTYVAPGFLARLGYRARYPGLDRPAGEVFIVSVVLSLPLVALVTALLPGKQTADQLGYIALLLGLALVVGYVAALIRGRQKVKSLLAKAGYTLDPEGTIYAHTLRHMSESGTVLVETKDGRRISGCPRAGPQSKDDGVNELYLVYAEALDEDGEWQSLGGPAVIIPLSEVASIVL